MCLKKEAHNAVSTICMRCANTDEVTLKPTWLPIRGVRAQRAHCCQLVLWCKRRPHIPNPQLLQCTTAWHLQIDCTSVLSRSGSVQTVPVGMGNVRWWGDTDSTAAAAECMTNCTQHLATLQVSSV